MTSEEIVKLLQEQFGQRIIAAFPADKHPRVHIQSEYLRAVMEFLYREPRLKFDWLANLSGVDYVADGKLAVVYDLTSFDHKHTFAVKVFMQRENPHIASLCDLYPAANWHEREAFDMFGIIFEGHPNLCRILCCEDWVGFPLRKDYVFPKEYHGIPAGLNLEWDPSSKPPVTK